MERQVRGKWREGINREEWGRREEEKGERERESESERERGGGLVRRICEVKCRNCSRLGYKCQTRYS